MRGLSRFQRHPARGGEWEHARQSWARPHSHRRRRLSPARRAEPDRVLGGPQPGPGHDRHDPAGQVRRRDRPRQAAGRPAWRRRLPGRHHRIRRPVLPGLTVRGRPAGPAAAQPARGHLGRPRRRGDPRREPRGKQHRGLHQPAVVGLLGAAAPGGDVRHARRPRRGRLRHLPRPHLHPARSARPQHGRRGRVRHLPAGGARGLPGAVVGRDRPGPGRRREPADRPRPVLRARRRRRALQLREVQVRRRRGRRLRTQRGRRLRGAQAALPRPGGRRPHPRDDPGHLRHPRRPHRRLHGGPGAGGPQEHAARRPPRRRRLGLRHRLHRGPRPRHPHRRPDRAGRTRRDHA